MSLTLDSIWYSYGRTPVLQGVYLHVPGGTIGGLIGLNGSGKSTLLKIATGLVKQDQGVVDIEGLRRTPRRQAFVDSSIAYLPQDSLIPDLMPITTVAQSEFVRRALSYLNLSDGKRTTRLRDLSAGMRGLIDCTFVLDMNRSVMLLDEPFHGLDPHALELIHTMLREVRTEEKTILISDHDLRSLSRLIDQCHVLQNRQCRLVEFETGERGEMIDALRGGMR